MDLIQDREGAQHQPEDIHAREFTERARLGPLSAAQRSAASAFKDAVVPDVLTQS